MATSSILGIGTTISAPRTDDSMEVQSVSLGSAQMPMSALNTPMDSGLATLSSATAVTFTISYHSTLATAPTRWRLTLILPSVTASIPGIAVVPGTTSQFTLVLTGPTGDTTHKVFWEALA